MSALHPPLSNAMSVVTTPSLVRPALVLFVLLSLLTGLVYPLAITGMAQALFPEQAHGSLIVRKGQLVGSRLIGQTFTDPAHFWGRPSATSPMPHNAGSSSGSNLGPSNPALLDAIQARVEALHKADPLQKAPVPVDLVTASASGLDPHISMAAAQYQAQRVAKARSWPLAKVHDLIKQHSEEMMWGFLGEPRVNVLELNLAMDAASDTH